MNGGDPCCVRKNSNDDLVGDVLVDSASGMAFDVVSTASTLSSQQGILESYVS